MGKYCSCSDHKICTFTLQRALHSEPHWHFDSSYWGRRAWSSHWPLLFRFFFMKDFGTSDKRLASPRSGQLWAVSYEGGSKRLLPTMSKSRGSEEAEEVNRACKDFWQVAIKNYYRHKLIDYRRQGNSEECCPGRKLPCVETVSKRLFLNEIVPKTMFTGVS